MVYISPQKTGNPNFDPFFLVNQNEAGPTLLRIVGSLSRCQGSTSAGVDLVDTKSVGFRSRSVDFQSPRDFDVCFLLSRVSFVAGIVYIDN